ncbi:MAG: hypothetical protein R3F60_32155 [bacterium]
MKRWWVVAVGLLAACDDGGSAAPDGGGAMVDAASVDGAPDTAPRPDARAMDAAPADAAPPRPDAAEPDASAPDAQAPDAQPRDAAPPPPDAAVPDASPLVVPVCAPCGTDRDCSAPDVCQGLIDGSHCLTPCVGMGPCAAGFTCLGDRCIPAGARCDSCALQGCPGDQRCNAFTGACEPKAARCGACQEDAECQAGLRCVAHGFGRACLPPCPDGACPGDFMCQAGACVPAGGTCDVCGGCGGATPVCDFFSGQCVACGPASPCAPGLICSPAGACVEPGPGIECNAHVDCQDPARRLCQGNTCVACLDDAGCPAATRCQDGACAPADACAGVTCLAGSACVDGVCIAEDDGLPACADDADCGDEHRCNPLTGQCFRVDQRCDDGGACAPGSACRPDPFNPMATVCTCLKRDPADFAEANDQHLIPCQPGGVCVQLGPEPGICIAAP